LADGIPVEKGGMDADTIEDAWSGDPGGNKDLSEGSTGGIFSGFKRCSFRNF
jgi:hypothetical protein